MKIFNASALLLSLIVLMPAHADNIIRTPVPVSLAPVMPDLPPEVPQPEEPVNESGEFMVINPIPGQNGIYQVEYASGKRMPAYVNMSIDGGYWVLIAYWIGGVPEKTFSSVVERGAIINGVTQDAVNYPILSGVPNTSNKAMFISSNSGWISRYGSWLTFDTFANGAVLGSSGFIANTPLGSKTIYHARAGWKEVKTLSTSKFGLWTTWGSGGPCGGANVGTSDANEICPAITPAYSYHYDQKTPKFLFLKSK